MKAPIPRLEERRRLYRAALGFARSSRRIILERVARGFRSGRKADATLVTEVDLEVERALQTSILRRFPDHGILGEELPPVHPEAPFQWILDPIDGTQSFVHGIPFYGTIIGLHYHGRPLVGVIDYPALRARYSAALGLGAWCDGRRIRIRDVSAGSLRREIVSVADRWRFVLCGRGRAFDDLMRTHPHVRGYTDCLAHTLAAEGKIGAALDYGLRMWDLAATQVLIEEAGGRFVCAYQGRHRGVPLFGIICGKPRVVRWLLASFGGPRGNRARRGTRVPQT